MVDFKDYYKILGVPRDASAKDVKAAFRRLARKHHPDMNRGQAASEARFKEVNEAYEVLGDADKRRRYDELGANWNAQRAASGAGRRATRTRVEFGGQAGEFSDFFRTFFSGFGGAQFGEHAGADVFGERMPRPAAAPEDATVELTLEELLHGTTRTLELDRAGHKRRVEVKIPAGVREGSRVRVPAEAAGGGDLFLRVRVLPHARFERHDDDLRVTLEVRLSTAVLGGEGQVPTLDGGVSIRVPAGTPVGRVFRLRGQGLPKGPGGERGDLLAELSVALPRELGRPERELFEALRELGH